MNDKSEIIASSESPEGYVEVIHHDDGTYSVSVAGIVRHPRGDAEMAIRALAHYLNGVTYHLNEIMKQHDLVVPPV